MSQNIISRIDELWQRMGLPTCMAAYVGENYEQQGERILIIGESMYVPDSIACNFDLDSFYCGQKPLSSELQDFLNYRALIREFIIGSHVSPYLKYIEKSLVKTDSSLNDIAMFNFFQRPFSRKEKRCTSKDIEMGVKICHGAIELLRPTKVIFTSSSVFRMIKLRYSKYYPEEFLTFADKLNFKYIGVPHPASPSWFKGQEKFEKFITKSHGQERFRQLSELFENAIQEKNLDKLIRLAKDFKAEVDYMDEKRKGKCGVVTNQKDIEKNILNCQKARVAKKAKMVCGIVIDLLQKHLRDMNAALNTDFTSEGISKDALMAEIKIRRDIARKDANAEIEKFKEEFVEEEALKEQLEKGIKQISDIRDAQLGAIDALISSV